MHPIRVAHAWTLFESVTSSTKPELNNILRYCPRKNMGGKFSKSTGVWFLIYVANRQTYKHADRNTSLAPLYRGEAITLQLI